MLLSTEKSAGGEIVSNLCHFQGKHSQPHSLLGREAGGRGYSAPTLRSWGKAGPSWWLREWRAVPPPTANLSIPLSPTGIFLPLHEQTQPLSQEDDGHHERFRGWHEEVALTASQSIPAGGDCQMLPPPPRIPRISSMEMVLRRAKSTTVLSHQKISAKYLSQ